MTSVSAPKNIIIAAGGTGGHIYPGLAIAKSLQNLDPGIQIEFVGTSLGLESKIIPQSGYSLKLIEIGRLNSNVNIFERVKTLITLPMAFLKSAKFIIEKKPLLVIGVGGALTGPLLLIASLLRRKTLIWEPNAYPGLANRWLSRFVDECLLVFEPAKKYMSNKNCKIVGMPVRDQFEKFEKPQNMSNDFKIFIFGGSQGATAINNTVSEMITSGQYDLSGISFVHQTGARDFEFVSNQYRDNNVKNVEVYEYIKDMNKYYQWADLVISRAGTGSISEFAACGMASILIPLPSSADDHQRKNAEALAVKDASIMLLQKDLTAETLYLQIIALKARPDLIRQMSENVKQFHRPNAALEIAKYIQTVI